MLIAAQCSAIPRQDVRRVDGGGPGFGGSAALRGYLDRDAVRAALRLPRASATGPWGQGNGSAFVERALVADLNAPTSLPLWPGILARGPSRFCGGGLLPIEQCCVAQPWPGFSFPRIALPFRDRRHRWPPRCPSRLRNP